MGATVFQNGIASSLIGADDFISGKIIVTGKVYWVDSVHGNDSNAGTEEKPFATVAAAHTAATASNGDIIVLKSGHHETLTSAISLTKAGIKIFGLGTGTARPAFTVNASAIYGFDISGNDTELNNLYFPAGTSAANTARVNVNADTVVVRNCAFTCGVNDANSVLVESSGTNFLSDGSTFVITAAGPATGIKFASASARAGKVTGGSFDGASIGFSNGAIYSAVAHLDFEYSGVTLTNGADIVHTAAAKGFVSGIITGANCQVSV